MTEKTNPSEVKVKIEALSNPSTPLEKKKSNVEFLLSLGIKNKDFVDVVKEGGILVLTNLFKITNDIELKVKITTLLLFLSLTGPSGPMIEKLMSDINILSLINLFSEKDFGVFMQAFDGLKILGEDAVTSSTSTPIAKSSISFSLSAATLFLQNMTTLINPSSKLLSDDQKTQALGKFSKFVMTGVMVQAAVDAAKDSSSQLSKNFTGAYTNFEKTLESCQIGDYSLLDLVVTRLLQLVKEGKLVGIPPPWGNLNPNLAIINQWLGGSKKYNLLYQASKDGTVCSTFHSKCDNKGPTVTIVTSSEGYVFGGYTPVAWNGGINSYSPDNSNQSFVFSLKNPRSEQPTKFHLKESKTEAIYNSNSYGPTFGGGHDFTCGYSSKIGDNTYSNFDYSYKNTTSVPGNTVFTGQQKYTLKDVEVYQVQ